MADTREALADAVRAHVAAEANGAYLTDWVLIAAAAVANDPDATTYVSETSEGPFHHRLGLVRYLAQRTDQMVGDDDDD